MDFEFTEEQRALQESTRGLLAAKAPVQATRELLGAGEDFDAGLWQHGAKLGWPALAVAESDGGLGQQLVDLVIVAVEHGRFLLPSPFIPTVVTADAVAGSPFSGKSEVLSGLLDGSATAAWAYCERGRPSSVATLGVQAERCSDRYVLTGDQANVQDAGSARWLLVDALLDGEAARFIVPADAAGITPRREQVLDITRAYYDVEFDQVVVGPESSLASGSDAVAAINRSAQMTAVLACAELVGIGEQLLAMTVQYVTDRVQFGRAIGSFQAIKHKCATMRLWVQAATAATYYAAMTWDAQATDLERAVSVAKAYASDAICRCAGEALQLHGGIGFTWEHDLHLYTRRARTLALLYGDATHHRELLCRSLELSGAGSKWNSSAE